MPMDMISDYKRIADYSAIGNLRSVALVGRDGSIDWCCFPQLDRPSVYAAILDAYKGGRFLVGPEDGSFGSQRYLEKTNIIETSFHNEEGSWKVIDFMPVMGDEKRLLARDEIYRFITCDQGTASVKVEWSPSFDYARALTTITREDGSWLAQGGEVAMSLSGLNVGSIVQTANGQMLKAKLGLEAGDKVVLINRWLGENYSVHSLYQENHISFDRFKESQERLNRTIASWRSWTNGITLKECGRMGKWSPIVERSVLALKLLMNEDTGAIVAAPTTSLPEWIGGERNWDYRFAWIRDGSLTAQALISLGHMNDAVRFLCWLEGVSTSNGANGWGVRILHGIGGEGKIEEGLLPHLNGYKGSKPVRVGNAAYKQFQLEGYGELMIAAYELSRRGVKLSPGMIHFLYRMMDEAVQAWQNPDQGIWEIRDQPRHFVYSKVLVWAALNRALRLSRWYDLEWDTKSWRIAKQEIKRTVLERGYDEELGTFVQSFDSNYLDAANLRLPVLGFLPFNDKRIQGTIDRTMADLMQNGLIYRYKNKDGLSGGEGAFAACTFWLVDALALSGRLEEAWDLFENMMKRANHVGLFSEQYNPATGEALGNFPQGFTHIGLINSAVYLTYAEGYRLPGIEPIGIFPCEND